MPDLARSDGRWNGEISGHRLHFNHPGAAMIPSSGEWVPRAGGRRLDAATRAFMEPRFGHDFSNVLVHADAEAAAAAESIQARAYTVGRHLVFGAGEYSPASLNGRRLIAHELAHVVQQGSAVRLGHDVEVANGTGSHASAKAPRFGNSVIPLSQTAGGSRIQRQERERRPSFRCRWICAQQLGAAVRRRRSPR